MTRIRLVIVGYGDPPTLKLRRGKHGDGGTRSDAVIGSLNLKPGTLP